MHSDSYQNLTVALEVYRATPSETALRSYTNAFSAYHRVVAAKTLVLASKPDLAAQIASRALAADLCGDDTDQIAFLDQCFIFYNLLTSNQE